MWSFSFAGSMRSSTALIGRGVAIGDGVGAGVGETLGVATTAAGDGDAAGATVAPPQEARTIASTTRCRPTMPVYRASGQISASASGPRSPEEGFLRSRSAAAQ